ncbi:MAG: glycosyltransferase family 39 protein [Anaerolineae bacterium]|nr:glycosyltransferase family 39 protein [Anaerolineae bacterium]
MSAKHTGHRGGLPWLLLLLLLLLVVVALVLRWRYIEEISLFVDEFVTAWAARRVLRTGLPIFPSGNVYPHGFLFTYLEAPFVLGQFDETLARAPALLVSLATLPVAYLIGRRMLSEQAGLVAAAAMAVDPEFIVWGSRARMYALLQLLSLLAVYVYYRGLAEDRPACRYAAMGLVVAAIFTHLEAAFLLPVLGVATLLVLPWRRVWRWSVILPLAIGGAGAIAFFLIANYGQPGHLGALEQEGRSYLNLTGDLVGGVRAFAPVFTALHRLPFTLLAVAGVPLLFRPRFCARAPLVYLYAAFAGFVLLVVLLAGATWERERYLFLILPLLFLIGGEVSRRLLALARVEGRLRQWQPAAMAAVVALYVGFTGAGDAYTQEWGYDLAFRYLQDQFNPEAGDRLATSMSTAAMLYLGQNDAFTIQQGYEEYVVVPQGADVPVDLWTATPVVTTTTDFVSLLDAAPVLWFVVDGWRFQTRYEFDFILTVLDQMEKVYDERGVMVFRGVGYNPPSEPTFRRVVGAEFQDVLALEGFGLSSTRLAPGDDLEVTLYWRALEDAGPAYTTFLHLVAADGSGVAGIDEPILGGVYQPALWSKDATLPDRHVLTIPADLPPGRYRLDAGLYPSGDPGQVVAVGSADLVALATLGIGGTPGSGPGVRVGTTFGGQIRLVGYDVLRAGELLRLTLYWEAVTPVSRDYTVFFHLLNGADGIVAQDDHPPGGAFSPTSTWLPGSIVADEHQVVGEVNGDKEYGVLAGLYDPTTNERLPAVNPAGEAIGDSVLLPLNVP